MDKKDSGFQNTESSAKKAIKRVKSDPDNSGRSAVTPSGRQDSDARRLARTSSQDANRSFGSSSNNRQQSGQAAGRQDRQRSAREPGEKPRRTGQQSGQRPVREAGSEQRRAGQQRPDKPVRPQSGQRPDSYQEGQTKRRPGQSTNADRQDGRIKPESRSYIPLEEADKNYYSDIRINKKMRTWNKYKNYIFAAAAIIVLIIIVAVSVRSCSKDKPDDNIQKATQSLGALQPSSSGIPVPTQSVQQTSEPDTQTQQKPQTGTVLTTTRTAAKEEFTNAAAFDNSIFIGDSIASGISYYRFLDGSRVVADTNLTAPKALDRVGEIASAGPDKVYIMLGLNDLNYNSKTVDSITQDFDSLVSQIKQSVPSASIYIVSVTPITKSCEDRTNIYITMSNIEALNGKLKEMAAKQGACFVDINTAFQDSSGYLNSEVTGNGYNMKNEYYGFMLNTIAEMTK